jgi:hypothetical protein
MLGFLTNNHLKNNKAHILFLLYSSPLFFRMCKNSEKDACGKISGQKLQTYVYVLYKEVPDLSLRAVLLKRTVFSIFLELKHWLDHPSIGTFLWKLVGVDRFTLFPK